MKNKTTYYSPRVNTNPYTFASTPITPGNLTTVPDLNLKTCHLFSWVSGDTVFILNPESVEEILIPEPNQIVRSKEQQFLHWGEQMIPAYRVSELVNDSHLPRQAHFPQDEKPDLMLVVSLGKQIFALQPEIDYLMSDGDLVIQPFAAQMALPHYMYGCTVWKNRLHQVINVADLLTQPFHHRQIVDPPVGGSDEPHEYQLGAQPSHNEITPATTVVKKSTVLIIDDSKTVRLVMSLTLQKAGYQVMWAEDGQEGIAQLQKNTSIKVVICDIDMPYLNGYEFLSHRLKDPMLAKVPVLILSSWDTNTSRKLAMQLGAATYLTKPYVEEEFLAAITAIVDQH